jgi:hypothetical protein
MMASEYEQKPICNRGMLTRYKWCKFHWSMLVQSHRHQTCQPSRIGTLKVEEDFETTEIYIYSDNINISAYRRLAK